MRENREPFAIIIAFKAELNIIIVFDIIAIETKAIYR